MVILGESKQGVSDWLLTNIEVGSIPTPPAIYPPFPFEHILGSKYLLNINEEYNIDKMDQLTGFIKRLKNEKRFYPDSTFPLLCQKDFEKAIKEFKELYDFNNSFEDHLNKE